MAGLPTTRPIPVGRVRPGISRRALGGVSLLVILASGAVIALSGVGAPRGLGALHGWSAPLLRPSVHITRAQFDLVLLAMAAGYLGVLAFVGHLTVRWLAGAIVVLHVLFLLGPPLLSTDVFSYVGYARLGALHHLDPYVTTPAAGPHDALYRFLHWRHTLSVYGPVFTLTSYPLAHLAPADAVMAFKAAAAAASLGCVALVWRIASLLGRPRRAAIAIFGLNPLLLVWTVGGGHNDLLMLVAMLGAFALVLGAREVTGGAALAAAVAIKASAGLALPFLVLGGGRRLRVVAGLGAGAALVAVLAFVAFPDHAVGMLGVLRSEQHLVSQDSVPHVVARWLGLHGLPSPVRIAFTALFVVVLVAALVRACRGGDSLAACGWAFAGLVVSSTWLLGWYTVWPLPFAAVAADRRRRLLVATLALQVFFVATRFHL
jgi:alpha-1,6-mannosyltransferase